MTSAKYSNAGYRVLEVLKELAKKPLSTLEVLRYIEETTDNIYRKELVLKYFNTLRLMNIDIKKVGDKYCLQKSLELMDFDKRDLSILQFIRKYVDNMGHERFKDNIFESLQIIEKNFSPKTQELIDSNHVRIYKPEKPLRIKDDDVKKFEKYCTDAQKVELVYNDGSNSEELSYTVLPLKLIYKKGKAVFIGYDHKDNDYKEFVIENVISSKQMPQKDVQGSPSSVLFKLKNRLAKSYVLKNDEKVLEYGSNFIIVSNKGEDKELLLKRLLRYYDQCEIMYPKIYRTKIMELIEEMEALYA